MIEPAYVRDTRAAYDTVAVDYAALLSTALAAQPVDRALLGLFAELVRDTGQACVADLGCGPGRVTAHLDGLGLTTSGIDLSPEMVAVARRTYPELRFDQGSIADLDLADGTLGGLVAWYSIIHTPPERLPVIFAEFSRLLVPGGYLLLAFQVGDERVHLEHAYGHAISLDAYRLAPNIVAALLARAGFLMHTRVTRAPNGHEKLEQAYLVVRKAGTSSQSGGQRGGNDIPRQRLG